MAHDKATMVCRDCGEVSRYELATLKPGGLVACLACGLVADPAHVRWPVLARGGPGPAPPGAPRRVGRPGALRR